MQYSGNVAGRHRAGIYHTGSNTRPNKSCTFQIHLRIQENSYIDT